ncbi:glycosyltransferase [Georgenia sp. MJ170]|uniref:glycosyltransferase n=1 Tax=Georgenia sunbinii TaxID=3117728 RepID=UPI002F2686E5
MADADRRLGDAATLAVVVTPGVSAYLYRTLRGVAEQDIPAGTVLVVDTSAPDREVGTGVPIADVVDAVGLDDVSRTRIVRVPAARTFGAAVRAALREHGEHELREARHRDPEAPEPSVPPWLWLLHDDSAPEPATLGELVRTIESGPSIAVAGAKQRDWERPDLLLEAGLRATVSGRRVPDIESGEIDQGQHDSREDVLAVGTAGALVRREVWDELGGPDPALGPFSDGLELSLRVWRAGHRVVLVPGAVVHHARASFHGLRDLSTRRAEPATVPDPRRSFVARRRAQLFIWLLSVRAPWLPLVVVAILVLAPLRALWRLATKELGLVGAEMRAAAEVLARPASILRARRRHRRTARVPSRYLRPLRASGADVARAKRDERRSLAAARSRRRAPSELEIAEHAALARRRRTAFWILTVALSGIGLAALGPWLTGGPLVGGALAAVESTAGELWGAATSAWVAAGLGHAGPGDPFLAVLAIAALPLAPFGGDASLLTTAVLVLAVPLAGIGAWFAAGAATRSVLLRAWAAAVWAVAPALLLATGQGRLGAVVAHLLLPWVAMGIARAVGVERRDVVLSGMVGAKRVGRPADPAGRPAPDDAVIADDVGTAVVGDGADTAAPDSGDLAADADGTSVVDNSAVGAESDAAAVDNPAVGAGAGAGAGAGEGAAAVDNPAVGVESGAGVVDNSALGTKSAAGAVDNPAVGAGVDGAGVDAAGVDGAGVGDPRGGRAAGSIAAAAGAGLALAAVTAGAPVLLPAGLLTLVLLAVVVPRRRRLLALVGLPSLLVFGPLLMAARADVADGSWRVLLAGPGQPFEVSPGAAWLAGLGWPQDPPDVALPGLAASPWPLVAAVAGGGALLLVAVLALLRGTGRARAVRAGWIAAVIGLGAAVVASRTPVAAGADLEGQWQLVHGWSGAGLSLATLGLLVAAVSAADGMTSSLAARAFGWRQVAAVLVVATMVLGPLVTTTAWLATVLTQRGSVTELDAVRGRDAPPVPALAIDLQHGPERSRVLALDAQEDGLRAEIWRRAGHQLIETSSLVAARAVTGVGTGAQPSPADPASEELTVLVAQLAAGTTEAAGSELGRLAVGVVVVPPAATGTDPVARQSLISRLDSTAGLERVTENESGVIWRVSQSDAATAAASSVARAQLVAADGTVLDAVPAGDVDVRATVPGGDEGRTVVLAERADSGWQATYNGRSLRATSDGWRQAFELPAHTGELVIEYEPGWQLPWRVAQGVGLGLVLLLAIPVRRRREVVQP